jgi:putative ABC transport system substrate-binding protein
MQFDQLKRREFIALLSGAAAWPLAARGQQPAMPAIGFISNYPAETNPKFLQAFRQGLNAAGFVEGHNITIEFRWADEDQYDQLPMMATDLVDRRVAVLFASPTPAAFAAKVATTTIPIVFAIGSDPVEIGLVSSLNRPGGNITGVTFLAGELGAKRLELLHDLLPGMASIALLVNPSNPIAARQIKEMQVAASALRVQLNVLSAGSIGEFDNAFAELVRQRIDALVVSADAFFLSHRHLLVALAAHHAVPAIYHECEFAMAGGLISYAPSFTDSFRQAGDYAAQILKGRKPAHLPVLQPTKFELVINVKAAEALGMEIPPKHLAFADKVID